MLILLFLNLISPAKIMANREITIYNRCPFDVWPNISATKSPRNIENFRLSNEEARTIFVSADWDGKIWARTWCNQNGQRCQTGVSVYTKAEFQLDSNRIEDVYDVSLINGYNIPMLIDPFGGEDCQRAGGCFTDINQVCPNNMAIRYNGRVVGCKSPCAATNSDRECCRNLFSTPNACYRSSLAETFKKACPGAYSYRFDDATSSFGCQTNAAYLVQFC